MEIDPSKYDILLAGPRVSRLRPFFVERHYRVDASGTGREALDALQEKLYHVVILELDLEDLEPRDFLGAARAIQAKTSYVLLDDPAKSMMIVSTFVAGVDAYIPTPPDEVSLFEVVKRQVLAAAARGGGRSELEQIERELGSARAALESTGQQVRKLRDEVDSLTHENARLEGRATTAERALEEARAELEQARAEAKAKAASAAKSRVDVEAMRDKDDLIALQEAELEDLRDQLARLKGAGGPVASAMLAASALMTGEGDSVDDDGLLLSEDEDGSLIVESPAAESTAAGTDLVLDDVDDLLAAAVEEVSGSTLVRPPRGPTAATDDDAVLSALMDLEEQISLEGTATGVRPGGAMGIDQILSDEESPVDGATETLPRLETRDFPVRAAPAIAEPVDAEPVDEANEATRLLTDDELPGVPVLDSGLGLDDEATRAIALPDPALIQASMVADSPEEESTRIGSPLGSSAPSHATGVLTAPPPPADADAFDDATANHATPFAGPPSADEEFSIDERTAANELPSGLSQLSPEELFGDLGVGDAPTLAIPTVPKPGGRPLASNDDDQALSKVVTPSPEQRELLANATQLRARSSISNQALGTGPGPRAIAARSSPRVEAPFTGDDEPKTGELGTAVVDGIARRGAANAGRANRTVIEGEDISFDD